ncbi:MAG: hypothetical protein HC924_15850 [Synechococcaceae cyanobacterium SM2_3_2]|nr:hypothetical protein [Synechococcaceae cyanobacterium SM2_3_2]
MTFDPRTLATPVYEALTDLKQHNNGDTLKEQKGQSVELYTYLSTWGLMRLKAEEEALSKLGKKQVVQKFFECLELLSGNSHLAGRPGLDTLKNLDVESYLGLTGLGLSLAQEFSFWATAVYWDIKGGE